MDNEGGTHTVPPSSLKPIDKKHRDKPGNPVELETQGDGISVAIKEEAAGYVKAILKTGNVEVQVKALDYTSKNDNIEVIYPGGRIAKVKKSEIKLFEAGVYNSEQDVNNNPKTDENKPDKLTGKLDNVLFHVDSTIAHLDELRAMIEETTSISAKTIESCIAELTSYKETLTKEKELSSGADV